MDHVIIHLFGENQQPEKSKGGRGSPCLIPLPQRNIEPGTPFSKTEDVAEARSDLIQLHHLIPKTFA
jgi:hypothetical protein